MRRMIRYYSVIKFVIRDVLRSIEQGYKENLSTRATMKLVNGVRYCSDCTRLLRNRDVSETFNLTP